MRRVRSAGRGYGRRQARARHRKFRAYREPACRQRARRASRPSAAFHAQAFREQGGAEAQEAIRGGSGLSREAPCRQKKRYAEDAEFREKVLGGGRQHRDANKVAINTARRERYATDPDYAEPYRARRRNNGYVHADRLRTAYRITIADYDALLARQNGSAGSARRFRRPQARVDHCHVTDMIRGLLCSDCNLGLGSFRTTRPGWARPPTTSRRRPPVLARPTVSTSAGRERCEAGRPRQAGGPKQEGVEQDRVSKEGVETDRVRSRRGRRAPPGPRRD